MFETEGSCLCELRSVWFVTHFFLLIGKKTMSTTRATEKDLSLHTHIAQPEHVTGEVNNIVPLQWHLTRYFPKVFWELIIVLAHFYNSTPPQGVPPTAVTARPGTAWAPSWRLWALIHITHKATGQQAQESSQKVKAIWKMKISSSKLLLLMID